ncbi:MAG: hypothetical protein AAFY55_10600, partial [Bacteroidota bacterium]
TDVDRVSQNSEIWTLPASPFVVVPQTELPPTPSYVCIRAINGQGMPSNISCTGPVVPDLSPPVVPGLDLTYNEPNWLLGEATLGITLNGVYDTGTGVTKVTYLIIKADGSAFVTSGTLAELDPPATTPTTLAETIPMGNAEPGDRVTVYVRDGTGQQTIVTGTIPSNELVFETEGPVITLPPGFMVPVQGSGGGN